MNTKREKIEKKHKTIVTEYFEEMSKKSISRLL